MHIYFSFYHQNEVKLHIRKSTIFDRQFHCWKTQSMFLDHSALLQERIQNILNAFVNPIVPGSVGCPCVFYDKTYIYLF